MNPSANAGTGSHLDKVQTLFRDSIDLKTRALPLLAPVIVQMAEIIAGAIRNGGKVLFCGNGGSAADAQHFAAELLVRLRPHVNRAGVPALALACDTSTITACGNDYGYEVLYERMTQALGNPGDVLVGITTSGRSPNVVRALRAAREKKMIPLGFLGGDGHPALEECQLALVVPSSLTGRIQEFHVTAGHAMLELVEEILIADGFLTVAERAQA